MKTMRILLVFLSSLLLVSCNNDDSSDSFWIDIATVENPNKENHFFFTLDNGEKMWTAETNRPSYYPADGQRIIANYTILSGGGKEGSYNHNVILNDAYSVLTKSIVDITPSNNDALGSDPIHILDMWVGSDFLNVEFEYAGYGKVHYLNLGNDHSKSYGDGKVHLELRHNANSDSPSYLMRGIASFRLKSLQTAGVSSIPLVIHYIEPGGVKKQHELTYKFNAPSGGDKTFAPGSYNTTVE